MIDNGVTEYLTTVRGRKASAGIASRAYKSRNNIPTYFQYAKINKTLSVLNPDIKQTIFLMTHSL